LLLQSGTCLQALQAFLLTKNIHKPFCSPKTFTSLSVHQKHPQALLLTKNIHKPFCSPNIHKPFCSPKTFTSLSAHEKSCTPTIRTGAAITNDADAGLGTRHGLSVILPLKFQLTMPRDKYA
jgi:hypothetical protein